MDLGEIKKRKDILCAELKQKAEGKHLNCPLHEDKNGSLSIYDNDGIWFWKCHAGCGEGTIIDAVMLMRNLGHRAAINALGADLGEKVSKPLPERPKLNIERAQKVIDTAHERLLNDLSFQEKYMMGVRGIKNTSTITRYKLGCLWGARIQGWGEWSIHGWIIPITDKDGTLGGVRIHQEKRVPYTMPKSLWFPCGMENKKHAFVTVWPAPESFEPSEYQGRIFLCPGELKALAMIDAGFAATSCTYGESPLYEALVPRFKKFSKVVLCYDNDPAGKKWLSKNYDILWDAGFSVQKITFSDLVR